MFIIIIITYLTKVNLSVKAVINGENDTNFSTEEYRQLQQIKMKISSYRCKNGAWAPAKKVPFFADSVPTVEIKVSKYRWNLINIGRVPF